MVDHQESVVKEEKAKESEETKEKSTNESKEEEKENKQQKGKWVLKKTLTDREILSQVG